MVFPLSAREIILASPINQSAAAATLSNKSYLYTPHPTYIYRYSNSFSPRHIHTQTNTPTDLFANITIEHTCAHTHSHIYTKTQSHCN